MKPRFQKVVEVFHCIEKIRIFQSYIRLLCSTESRLLCLDLIFYFILIDAIVSVTVKPPRLAGG